MSIEFPISEKLNPEKPILNATLQKLKELNDKRRNVLAKCLGFQSGDQLGVVLGKQEEKSQIHRLKEKEKITVLSSCSAQQDNCSTLPITLRSPRKKQDARRHDDVEKSEKFKTTCQRFETVEKIKLEQRDKDIHKNGKMECKERKTVAGQKEQKAYVVAKRNVEDLDGPRPAIKRARARGDDDQEEIESFEDYFKALQEDERVYKGSSAFLKGTQSANPHNDYSQHYVDTGQRPQNFIRDAGLNERYDEYPKLKELIKLKDQLVTSTATPPMYLKKDPLCLEAGELGCRFDVIVVEPPLAEYYHVTHQQSMGGGTSTQQCVTWDQIERLDIASLADQRCFIWLWCGSSPEGLDNGRQCLKRWGFRRCEDICWVKRNCNSLINKDAVTRPCDQTSLFQRTKEHCLMGIKGTVRRSTDGDFIHANVDIDLIITEESSTSDLLEKPLELFLIAEHFCLGRRRLHLFGRDGTLRAGWLTVGRQLTTSNFDPLKYRRAFSNAQQQQTSAGTSVGGLCSQFTTGSSEDIEGLRPKSPPPGGVASSNAASSSGSMMILNKSSTGSCSGLIMSSRKEKTSQNLKNKLKQPDAACRRGQVVNNNQRRQQITVGRLNASTAVSSARKFLRQKVDKASRFIASRRPAVLASKKPPIGTSLSKSSLRTQPASASRSLGVRRAAVNINGTHNAASSSSFRLLRSASSPSASIVHPSQQYYRVAHRRYHRSRDSLPSSSINDRRSPAPRRTSTLIATRHLPSRSHAFSRVVQSPRTNVASFRRTHQSSSSSSSLFNRVSSRNDQSSRSQASRAYYDSISRLTHRNNGYSVSSRSRQDNHHYQGRVILSDADARCFGDGARRRTAMYNNTNTYSTYPSRPKSGTATYDLKHRRSFQDRRR